MMIAKSAAVAATARHNFIGKDGHSAWVTGYFGTEPLSDPSLPRPAADALFPVAFMVEEDSHATLGMHFHHANQFQLFVSGGGHLGQQTIAPFSVHYADAFTAYGPIRAGDEGLAYLTLRNGWDTGPRYMPELREEMRNGGGPGYQTRLTAIPNGKAQAQDIFKPADDGLAGWTYRIAPGASLTLPDPARGGGQYLIIREGAIIADELEMGRLSCAFIAPNDAQQSVTALNDGADIIVLQFPLAKAPRRLS
jgi:hypothetical protein